MECSAQTSAVTGLVASFPSELVLTLGAGYTPIWEWISIIPGVIHLPVASTVINSLDRGSSLPIAIIFPSWIIISVSINSLPSPS